MTASVLPWLGGGVVALAAGTGSGARERREFRAFVHRFLDALYRADPGDARP